MAKLSFKQYFLPLIFLLLLAIVLSLILEKYQVEKYRILLIYLALICFFVAIAFPPFLVKTFREMDLFVFIKDDRIFKMTFFLLSILFLVLSIVL